jgi:hypothetical protein
MNRPAICFAAFLAASGSARADSLTDEVGVGTTDTSRQSPRAGNFSNNLNASFDLSDKWILNAGLALTLEGATTPPKGSNFAGSASGVVAFSAGLEFDPSEHVSLNLDADVSPQSTQTSSSQLKYVDSTGKQGDANTELRVASSNSSLAGSVSYESAGESNFEWGLNLGLTATHFNSTQRITRVQTANGPVTTQQVIASCNANPGPTPPCSRAEMQALRASTYSLDSAKVSVGSSITAFSDTDLSVAFDYYSYNQDPTQAGYFSLGNAGRTVVSGGGGIAIAPLRYLVRPEIGHRFGDFLARLWVTSGEYVHQTGQATRSIGTKMQYKFTKAFRLWASASFQRDIDANGIASNSANYGLGAGYHF